MIKGDKSKDAKNKEKQDLTKSSQNLVYLISQLDESALSSMASINRANDLDKVEMIYCKPIITQRPKWTQTRKNRS